MPEQDLEHSIPGILAAIGAVFAEQGNDADARLLTDAAISVEQSSFDNWNGGTYGYTVQIRTSARRFAALADRVNQLESDIKARIGHFARAYSNEHVDSVVITPAIEDPATNLQLAPSFWPAGHLRVFLSHAADYRAEAGNIASVLLDFGVQAFVAHDHIEPTREWENEIRIALSTCDAIGCLLTPAFPTSEWTNQEVGFAIGLGKLAIPVQLGCVPYGFMARYQGYQARQATPSDVALAIVKVLANHEITRLKMASALVHSFENSESFAMAKARVNRLELISTWSEDLIARVERAAVNNSQIAEAFNVPQRVRQILAKAR